MGNLGRALAIAVVVLATAAPASAQVYFQPQPYQPPQSHVEKRPRMALLIPGISILAAGYLESVIISLPAGECYDFGFGGSSCPSDDTSEWEPFRYVGFVPLVGPWIQYGLFPSSAGDTSGFEIWLAYHGLVQAAGLTLIILGATLEVEITVYSGRDGVRFAVVPSAGRSSGGLSMVGVF